jgi:hypothetical protein
MDVLVDYGTDLLLVLTCAIGAGLLVAAALALALAGHSPWWRAARARCAATRQTPLRSGRRGH